MKKVRLSEKGQDRMLIEAAVAYPPKNAVREMVTNAIDARIPDTIEDIHLFIKPSERRLIIQDNGAGISFEDLLLLPERVGDSAKAGKIDKRGEKGLGLLAFGSLGAAMHMISRPIGQDSSRYGYVRWEKKENEGILWDDETAKMLDSQEIERDFYGNFPNGTQIIIDRIEPHTMDKLLTIANLKEWLPLLYNPAIRKGIVNIYVGKEDKRTRKFKKELLEPIQYKEDSSLTLIDNISQINIDKEDVPGKLEILLFVNPEAAYDKVAVYSKDVLVYESLGELPEFNKSPVWTSGKVTGYINDHFNKLILGRDGIERNRNAFRAWYNTLLELEEKIRPQVEESKKSGRRIKENKALKEAFSAFQDVYKELEREDSERFGRDKDGELKKVSGEAPSTEIEGKKHGPRKDPKCPTERPGPGNFVEDSEGYIERVVRKAGKGIIFGDAQPIAFPLHEIHLRSKLVDIMGRPTIFINNLTDDYKSRENEKDPTEIQRYNIDLWAKEGAFYKIKRYALEGKLVGDRVEIVSTALQEAEKIKYLTLRRLGIK